MLEMGMVLGAYFYDLNLLSVGLSFSYSGKAVTVSLCKKSLILLIKFKDSYLSSAIKVSLKRVAYSTTSGMGWLTN